MIALGGAGGKGERESGLRPGARTIRLAIRSLAAALFLLSAIALSAHAHVDGAEHPDCPGCTSARHLAAGLTEGACPTLAPAPAASAKPVGPSAAVPHQVPIHPFSPRAPPLPA